MCTASHTWSLVIQVTTLYDATHRLCCSYVPHWVLQWLAWAPAGIFPSYFWSFDREAAQHAWLDIISEHVVNGPADGVYDDCDSTIPLRCPDPETSNNTCVAKRNGKMASVNEQVTRAQMEAYTSGKNRTMLQAAKLVGVNGTFFNKNAGKPTERGPSFGGGNLQFMWPGGSRQDPGDPGKFAEDVAAALQHYTYLIIGGSNSFSNPKMESLPTGQNLADGRSLRTCDSDLVARFLLAVEPGVFLLCNGWDPRFDRKLGLPLGKAKLDSAPKHRFYHSADWQNFNLTQL